MFSAFNVFSTLKLLGEEDFLIYLIFDLLLCFIHITANHLFIINFNVHPPTFSNKTWYLVVYLPNSICKLTISICLHQLVASPSVFNNWHFSVWFLSIFIQGIPYAKPLFFRKFALNMLCWAISFFQRP